MSSNCVYVLKKGKNKGQVCGTKSVSGKEFCKKHLIETEPCSTINTDTHSTDNNTSNIVSTDNVQLKDVKEKKEKKEKEPKKSREKKEPVDNKKEKKEKEKIIKDTSVKVQVFDKIKLSAKRNSYGNYVLENNLVVHPVNKKIVGRQKDNEIVDISIEDIEFCKEHSLMYEQPSVMYFLDTENEKREIELNKQILSSLKNNDETDEFSEEEEEIEEEEEENEL